MPIARSKNLRRNLALLATSTLLSLLLAEALVRIVYPQQLAVWHTMRDGLVIHPPGLVTYLTEFKQEARFNAFGMRDQEHATRKPKGAARILVLGDSFMEALQVAFEDSFPSLVESGLRDKLNRNIEVINCAVSGWGQDDQLAYLRKNGRAFEPDLILVAMTLHNDVLDNLRERFHTLTDGKLSQKPVARLSESEFRILQLKGFFASHSHLWQLLRKLKTRRETRTLAAALDKHVAYLIGKNEEPKDLERGWTLTFALFKEIRDVAESMGARTAIMLIPLKLQLQEDALANFRAVAGISAGDLAIDKPQQAMRVFGHKAQIEIIDLLPDLRHWAIAHGASESKASLHLQEGHWNEIGHRLAASIAVKAIIERRLVQAIPAVSPSVPLGQRP
jgi:hypothetical protein